MLSYQELEKVLKEITNVYDAFALGMMINKC